MTTGRLGYNSVNDRYGLLVSDLWVHSGFHCGEGLEVMVDGRCVLTCALPALGLSPRSPRRMRALGERLVLMRSDKTNKALLLSEVTRP